MTGALQGSGEYRINLEKEAYEGLFSLATSSPAAFGVATEMLRGHISHTPKQRIPGRLKELKGAYKGLFQLSLAGANRLIYSVDDAEKQVYVEYCGAHPNWRALRTGRGL